jgi:hypothetical protein
MARVKMGLNVGDVIVVKKAFNYRTGITRIKKELRKK